LIPDRIGARVVAVTKGEKGGWSIGPALAPFMLEVHLDSWLREFGPRGAEKVEADSVEHLLDVLEERYPRLRFKIRDETGHLRRYVRVFVDGDDVSGSTGVATSLRDASTIDILHSIAGG
jgi:sulfur-carrier protein